MEEMSQVHSKAPIPIQVPSRFPFKDVWKKCRTRLFCHTTCLKQIHSPSLALPGPSSLEFPVSTHTLTQRQVSIQVPNQTPVQLPSQVPFKFPSRFLFRYYSDPIIRQFPPDLVLVETGGKWAEIGRGKWWKELPPSWN